MRRIHSEHSADYQKLPIHEGLKSKVITTSKMMNGVMVEIPKFECIIKTHQ